MIEPCPSCGVELDYDGRRHRITCPGCGAGLLRRPRETLRLAGFTQRLPGA